MVTSRPKYGRQRAGLLVWLVIYLPAGLMAALMLWPLAVLPALYLLYFALYDLVVRISAEGVIGLRPAFMQSCAVCGSRNRDGHGCHLDAIAARNGWVSRTGRHGRYKATQWKPVVRDHYGTVWEADRQMRRPDALKAAYEAMRAIQRGGGAIAADVVIGPRLGATTISHRVPLNDLNWPSMMRSADYRCTYCGEQFPARDLEREHDVPLARGGANHRSNIVVACARCNRRKGTMTGDEYRDKLRKVESRGHAGSNGRARSDRRLGVSAERERYPGICECGGRFALRTPRSGRRFYRCFTCGETKPLKKDL